MDEYKQVIEIFKMENELMEFNPSTGEKNPIELQNKDNQDLYKANLVAIEILEKQLNNGWIPVSERLPEEEGYYLVYDENHQIIIEWRYTDKDTEWDNPYFATDHNVLAWMPLPEPWKESVEVVNGIDSYSVNYKYATKIDSK